MNCLTTVVGWQLWVPLKISKAPLADDKSESHWLTSILVSSMSIVATPLKHQRYIYFNILSYQVFMFVLRFLWSVKFFFIKNHSDDPNEPRKHSELSFVLRFHSVLRREETKSQKQGMTRKSSVIFLKSLNYMILYRHAWWVLCFVYLVWYPLNVTDVLLSRSIYLWWW